eukprot:219947-Chlamydomonas_euryale.AAC.1
MHTSQAGPLACAGEAATGLGAQQAVLRRTGYRGSWLCNGLGFCKHPKSHHPIRIAWLNYT